MNAHPTLSALARNESRGGLRRMRSFLQHISPEHIALDERGGFDIGFPVIHVAGTNGKGSVVHILSALLQEAGYSVGTFTSPHLQRLNERIQVNGQDIADAELDTLLRELDRAREDWARAVGGGEADAEATLSFFEMLTVVGFIHLQRSAVDVGIVEVGVGGRLDATNLVDPIASAIVTVSLDHQDRLGPDIPSIASEKAGVIKTNRPVIVGPLSVDARKVIRLTAADQGATLIAHGEQFRTLRSEQARFTWVGGEQTLRDLPLALSGEHQIENAGVALAILQAISARFPVSEAHIRAGLAAVQHPGRLEWLSEDLLIDAAHNADGAASLARYLQTLPRTRPRTLVLGASQGKDIRMMVVQLAPHVDQILTTHCSYRRAVQAADIAQALVGIDRPILPAGAIEHALPLALDGDALVIVSGSVHIAGAARDLVKGQRLAP